MFLKLNYGNVQIISSSTPCKRIDSDLWLTVYWDWGRHRIEELWLWRGIQSNKQSVRLIPLVTIWAIWKERNNRTFESTYLILIDLKTLGSRPWVFFIRGQPFYCCEELPDLTDIMVELKYFYIRVAPTGCSLNIYYNFSSKNKLDILKVNISSSFWSAYNIANNNLD